MRNAKRIERQPFLSYDGAPSDMLTDISNVAHFLVDVAPYLVPENGMDIGLSEKGGQGLSIILRALSNSIDAACAELEQEARS